MNRPRRTPARRVAALFCGLGLAAATTSALAQTAVPVAGVSCTSGVTGCSNVIDGLYPPPWQSWLIDTAHWEGTADTVTLDLGGVHSLTGFDASLDNNDTYRFEVSLDGSAWSVWGDVDASLGSAAWGMDTFSTRAVHPYYQPALSFGTVSAAYVRVGAFSGDGFHAVGELQFHTGVSAVPEPASALLMVAGLAALGRRRKAGRIA